MYDGGPAAGSAWPPPARGPFWRRRRTLTICNRNDSFRREHSPIDRDAAAPSIVAKRIAPFLVPWTDVSHLRCLALASAVAILAPSQASTQPATTSAAPSIEYTVSMPQPHTHLLVVDMRLARAATADHVDLVMPVWTPGSYLVREYARHVQDFAATDAGGRPLAWAKVNKNSWRIATAGATALSVKYRVYANELTVRTNELNDSHAFWNNAALLMYPEGQLRAASTLRIIPPTGWKVATGLPPAAGRPDSYAAPSFDVLYDSPVEVGAFETLTFTMKGVPHRIVLDGHGNEDRERLRRDIEKIAQTESEMMGDIPYTDYTFLTHLRSAGSGGLEHLNSTALITPRFGFRPDTLYQDFLSLVAHEYFHLWNVKRIRPDALGPFDYTKENYTRLLWVAEGITSYYENLFLRRAGLLSSADYLDGVAKSIQQMQATPGRLVLSAEEASFDAWIKFYRQDENSANSQISYYDKGALLGLLLDLEIRKRSAGARSLDDVMRSLYTEFYRKGRNYSPADFQRVSEGAAGASLEPFFAHGVRGRDELDYDAALSAVGLHVDTTGGPPSTGARAQRAYLGAEIAQTADRLLVKRVFSGTPADVAGLNAGDQVVAINGMRATEDFLGARLKELEPGDVLHLTLFRFDDLRTIDLRIGRASGAATWRLVSVAQPTAEQLRVRRQWLGEP